MGLWFSKLKTRVNPIIVEKLLLAIEERMASVAVAVASMLLSGGCRSFGVPAAARALRISRSSLNKHHNKHALSRWFRSSNNSNTVLAIETESSTINNATSSSERYLVHSQETSYTNYDRLLPCPSHKSPPRIEHIVVSEGGSVLEYICKALDLPPL